MSTEKPLRVVVTGGYKGIGLELTKRLAAEGHTLGLVVRSAARLSLPPEVEATNPTVWEADLADQSQVATASEAILAEWPHVDVLFNNAGVLLGELRTSKQQNEMHLEVNTLAPYWLTRALKPLFDAADKPRVVNTVTDALQKTPLALDELIEPKRFRRLFGSYMHSKVALALLMNELAADEEWSNVRIRNVNPGPNKTSMTNGGDGMPWWLKPIAKLVFPGPATGAGLLYEGAFSSKLQSETGAYVSRSRVVPMDQVLTEEQGKALRARYQVALPSSP